jgi:DNA-binding XRE family transcriptional regulator
MTQCITLAGKEFVIMERGEYERIVAEAQLDLPPLPEPDAEGLTPATEYGRVLLARKLIRRRQTAGLTQKALAKSAGIRVETLNRVERGRVNPDETTMRKILRALYKAEARPRRRA